MNDIEIALRNIVTNTEYDIESDYYKLLAILKKINDIAASDIEFAFENLIDILIEIELAHQSYFDESEQLMRIKMCKYILELYHNELKNTEMPIDLGNFAAKEIYNIK